MQALLLGMTDEYSQPYKKLLQEEQDGRFIFNLYSQNIT
jgi:hypothetical protein